MADDMTVKNVQLWSLHGANRKGLLADVLEPLAAAGANLRVVMGYRHPGEHERATVEVFPVEGGAAEAAARKAGFAPSETACLRELLADRLLHQHGVLDGGDGRQEVLGGDGVRES